MTKTAGYVLGTLLLVVGVILIIFGFSKFFGAAGNVQNVGSSFSSAGMGMVLIFIGFVISGIGGLIIYFASIGKIFS